MNPPQVKPDIAGRLSWLDFHLDERSPRIFFPSQPRQRQFHRLDQYGGLSSFSLDHIKMPSVI